MKIMELEEELKVVASNLKSLEVSEEKANKREIANKEQVKTLTAKLKQAVARADFAERSVLKLNMEVVSTGSPKKVSDRNLKKHRQRQRQVAGVDKVSLHDENHSPIPNCSNAMGKYIKGPLASSFDFYQEIPFGTPCRCKRFLKKCIESKGKVRKISRILIDI